MTTFKHSMQLVQLKKHDPVAAAKAELLIKTGLWAMAGKLIAGTLKNILAEINDPRERLYQSLLAMVERGDVYDKAEVGTYKSHTVTLSQQPDNKMRLYARGTLSSSPVVIYGRDWKRQSSAYTGEWKITDDARAYNDGDCRRVFDAWVNKIDTMPVYESRYNGATL